MPDLSTCGELADYLATQPRDRKVILSKDAERNGFSPLADAGERMYEATSTWSGEVYQTPEVVAAEPDDWSDAPDDAERVVLLGPVN
jgi:hypothetical protein